MEQLHGDSKFHLQDSLSLNVKILHIFGYWPLESKQPTWRVVMYITYSRIMVCLLTLYIAQEGVSLVLIVGDLDKMITGSFVFLTHCAELIKIYTCFRRSARIHELLSNLTQPIFQPRNERQYKLASKTLQMSKRIYVSYLFVGVFTSTMLCLKDISGTKRALPFASYFPFDVQRR